MGSATRVAHYFKVKNITAFNAVIHGEETGRRNIHNSPFLFTVTVKL